MAHEQGRKKSAFRYRVVQYALTRASPKEHWSFYCTIAESNDCCWSLNFENCEYACQGALTQQTTENVLLRAAYCFTTEKVGGPF